MKLGRVKIVVVYKVDRLTRSLADFAKLVNFSMPTNAGRQPFETAQAEGAVRVCQRSSARLGALPHH